MNGRLLGVLGANTVAAGMVIMLFGDFLFSLNDALAKWLVASFAVGQVLFLRSVGSAIILTPMVLRRPIHELWRVEQPWVQVMRVVFATMDLSLFYTAVVYLPLADVMTFYMAGPIYVAAISHFLLGERIGWRRWLAVLIGFVGVVIALRPSTAMLTWPSVYGLLGSLGFAMTLVLNRQLRKTSDATLVTWQAVVALVVGAILAIGHWKAMTPGELASLLLLGIIASAGHLLIARSLKMAPASVLAPLQYTLLIWAVILGWLFFGDLPDPQTWVGAAIIIGSGLFIFHRAKVKQDIEPAIPTDSSHG
ncbi:MAG: DMT family transporter [Neorhizobium sp.]|nr:DMT family transporter [Neorhizobium sp.]